MIKYYSNYLDIDYLVLPYPENIYMPPSGSIETWHIEGIDGVNTKGTPPHRDLSYPPLTLLYVYHCHGVELILEGKRNLCRKGWWLFNSHLLHQVVGNGELRALFWEGHTIEEVNKNLCQSQNKARVKLERALHAESSSKERLCIFPTGHRELSLDFTQGSVVMLKQPVKERVVL